MSKLAAIRIRGDIGAPEKIRQTLRQLKLKKKNTCIVRDDTAQVRGMLQKAKDYITFGEVSEETIKTLEDKRKDGENGYRLQNPKGGFERKGIKIDFNAGGVIGNRGSKINELIQKMI